VIKVRSVTTALINYKASKASEASQASWASQTSEVSKAAEVIGNVN
jgi:hypothetical protein